MLQPTTMMPHDLAAPPAPDAPDGAFALSNSAHSDLQQRQRAVILAYGRRTVSATNVARLLEDAASLISETFQLSLFGVVEPFDGAGQLHLRLESPGAESAVQTYPADPKQSLAAFAIREGRPVVCSDLALEKRFSDSFLLNRGVVSALMLPLTCKGQNLGAIGIYSPERFDFHSSDVEFGDTIVHLLMSAISRAEMAKALAGANQTLNTLLDSSESIVILTDTSGEITRINKTGEQLSGFTFDQLAARSFWATLVPPEELGQVRQQYRRVLETGRTVNFECTLATQNGLPRRIRWSLACMCDEDNAARSLVLSGVDITELQRLETALKLSQVSGAGTSEAAPGEASAADAPNYAGDISDSSQGESGEHVSHSPRRAYPYRQPVAPVINGRLPSTKRFQTVLFREIWSGGASFEMAERPQHEVLVMALGCAPNVHYMSARVIEAAPALIEGRRRFVVSCSFIERVYL